MHNQIGVKISRIFPTSVYSVDCSFLLDSTKKVLNSYKNNDDEWTHKSHNRASVNKEVLKDHSKLTKEIEIVVNGCLQEWQYEHPLKMSSSWFTKTSKGKRIHGHFHCNSLWSSVFYFEDCCPLLLISENIPAIYVDSKGQNGFLPYGTVEMEAKKGKMIIFPSSLRHATDIHMEEEDRYSLAMNFMPFGKCSATTDSSYDYR
jgi:uncharacterized protein (TIGR02466 family)